MTRQRVLAGTVLAAGAVVLVTALALRALDDDRAPSRPAAAPHAAPQAVLSGRKRLNTPRTGRSVDTHEAIALIGGCKVRQTMSLHSGLFYLELRSGGRVTVDRPNEKAIYAAIQRSQGECGSMSIAME
jgi:hypothetical protein